MIAVASIQQSVRRNANATRRYIVKKELKMIAVAGILLGYFVFAWIPFVAFEFYTIHCVATHALWEACESNCYTRYTAPPSYTPPTRQTSQQYSPGNINI